MDFSPSKKGLIKSRGMVISARKKHSPFGLGHFTDKED
ncbi:hypothetical protein HMPREF1144_2912 [Klebsiella sp. OBRC7]|nr:hypothetical protein HMPREF1144_2912 [Klebsiella sp. OBRC7]